MLSQANRNKRQYSGSSKDQRTHGQRDRDRILHSSALRRLAGVTQVVDPNEGLVFHNRLTHTLKVAQIGRRLAEKLLKDMKKLRLATKDYGGLNPEVVEAAALSHDLGHPPFGHTGKKELDRLVRNEGNLDDGYEGNAQTFRVVTRLELWRKDIPGLDLTRATLNAILKYPWLRQGKEGQLKNRKWGAYRADEETFLWAREPFSGSNRKTLEAEIMDWADDIAFSVHDLEDFYRAGLVPLEILATNDDRRKECLKEIFRRWDKVERIKSEETPREKFEAVFMELFLTIPIEKRFDGTLNQISALRIFTSSLISRYIQETAITKDPNEGKKLFENTRRLSS